MTLARTPIADNKSLNQFRELAKQEGEFWHHLFEVQLATGLRSIDVREMTWCSVDLEKGLVTIHESKQTKAKLTKATNKKLQTSALPKLKQYLRAIAVETGNDDLKTVVLAASSLEMALEFAAIMGADDKASQWLNEYYEQNRAQVQQEIIKSGSAKHKARIIDISGNKTAMDILKLRHEKYGVRSELVFSTLTLNSNRSSDDKPVTRQSVYRIMQKLQNKLEQWRESLSKAARERLQSLRLGCHTLRKSAATALYRASKDIALVSKWIGHSNPAVTMAYIGLDQQSIQDADCQLSQLLEG
ncbi:tyrosine-type recombinase/integrase [Vibrio agarivorans]|uniref:Tyrosine-type recombinase/integrase n=1 Tax=Vibrio agarivorans TaxID=153622 RepID=A0ABT7Y0U1_9VIBR|nr:tyrosine-type recombinase/integrase [Vibrio agarivorans]MDN2481653.1 tyrosine-type recombinase/integrase [Vibrio agarivorans]